MSEWARESEDLFKVARRAMTPSADDRARNRARLAAKLGAGALAGAAALTTSKATAGTAATGTAAKGLSLALVAKIAAPILVVGAATTVVAPKVIAQHHQAPAPTTALAPTKVAVAPATTATAQSAEPSAPSIDVNALPSATPTASAHHRSTPAPAASVSAEEAALVAELDGAIRSNDMARASKLVSEHEKRFPHGVLVEEREGARVLVRCTLGQSKASARAADAFLASHPRTPMRARILAACNTTDGQ